MEASIALDPEYMTVPELARKVRAPVQTVRHWRKVGYGPRGVRVGRRVLYRATEVREWLDQLASDQMEAAGDLA